MYSNRLFLALSFLGGACACMFSTSAYSSPFELKSDAFALRFAADGKPASLMDSSDSSELLNTADPGTGFAVIGKEPLKIRLTNLTLQKAGKLSARSENGTQEVVFSVHEAPNYIAFHIERIKGFPDSVELSLQFEINTAPRVKIMSLDYMTKVSDSGTAKKAIFDYLWHSSPRDPKGGFALYLSSSDAEQDDRIIEIFVGERMPHPNTGEEWTVKRAKEWVGQWKREYADQSSMYVEAETAEELYDVKYAERADIKMINLLPGVWRGAYWPTTMTTDAVNPKYFPKGEKDLLAYSNYLRKHGMHLNLYYVSGGIGFHDPEYVGSKPDHRLASWGSGEVAEAFSETDTTITIKPTFQGAVLSPFQFQCCEDRRRIDQRDII